MWIWISVIVPFDIIWIESAKNAKHFCGRSRECKTIKINLFFSIQCFTFSSVHLTWADGHLQHSHKSNILQTNYLKISLPKKNLYLYDCVTLSYARIHLIVQLSSEMTHQFRVRSCFACSDIRFFCWFKVFVLYATSKWQRTLEIKRTNAELVTDLLPLFDDDDDGDNMRGARENNSKNGTKFIQQTTAIWIDARTCTINWVDDWLFAKKFKLLSYSPIDSNRWFNRYMLRPLFAICTVSAVVCRSAIDQWGP